MITPASPTVRFSFLPRIFFLYPTLYNAMNLLQEGIKQGLIAFDDDKKNITYIHQKKKYRFSDPEEEVRAETYCSLVLQYNYKPSRIDFEVLMPSAVPRFYADIVVYEDDARTFPFIVIECKKPDVSEKEFQQAIEQGFGNAVSLRATYLWVTSGIKSKYYDTSDKFGALERVHNLLASIPRFGKRTKRAKLYKGGTDEDGDPAFDLKVVSQDELTRIFGTAHQALWGGGKRNEIEALDEFNKLIFCKLWDEKEPRKKGIPYDFQEFTGESPEFLLNRIRALYNKGKEKDPEVFRDDIRLPAEELKTIVGYLAEIYLGKTDLDSKGRAFEKFVGSNFRGKFGAYFTPREVVKFIVDALPMTHDSVVLDTSCGSGGFLLYALDKVRAEAERKAEEGYFEQGSVEQYRFWHDFASKRLFGIEINESTARTAKMNMIIHDDGHTNVVAQDGLQPIVELARAADNKGFAENAFDFIITNPPFGSVVKLTEQAFLETYFLGKKELWWIDRVLKNLGNSFQTGSRDSQSTEVLFIEQCHRFLKAGGFLAVVIPDGILTNSSLQYVRDWISNHYRIVAVVSLPQHTFAATGAGVKSSVLVVRKRSERETNQILEMQRRLQDRITAQTTHKIAIDRLDTEKEQTLKEWRGFDAMVIDWHSEENRAVSESGASIDALSEKERKKRVEKTAEFKAWKKEIADDFNDRIADEKERLEEAYNEALKAELPDYPIFMAIADNIGYDATGRSTPHNDLPRIAEELARFVEEVIAGRDSFFA